MMTLMDKVLKRDTMHNILIVQIHFRFYTQPNMARSYICDDFLQSEFQTLYSPTKLAYQICTPSLLTVRLDFRKMLPKQVIHYIV